MKSRKEKTMTKYEDLKANINELAKGVTDVEALKRLGVINAQIDSIEKSENELNDKHLKLINDYRESIIHAGLPAKDIPDEKGTPTPAQPKSVESIIDEILNKK